MGGEFGVQRDLNSSYPFNGFSVDNALSDQLFFYKKLEQNHFSSSSQLIDGGKTFKIYTDDSTGIIINSTKISYRYYVDSVTNNLLRKETYQKGILLSSESYDSLYEFDLANDSSKFNSEDIGNTQIKQCKLNKKNPFTKNIFVNLIKQYDIFYFDDLKNTLNPGFNISDECIILENKKEFFKYKTPNPSNHKFLTYSQGVNGNASQRIETSIFAQEPDIYSALPEELYRSIVSKDIKLSLGQQVVNAQYFELVEVSTTSKLKIDNPHYFTPGEKVPGRFYKIIFPHKNLWYEMNEYQSYTPPTLNEYVQHVTDHSSIKILDESSANILDH